MLIVDLTRDNNSITGELILNLLNSTGDLTELSNLTDVSAKMANVKFDSVAKLIEEYKLENNTNITGMLMTDLSNYQLFPPEWPAFVATILFVFSLGNIFIAVGPIFSKELRQTRATILLSLLAVVDFLACLGAGLENQYYARHPTWKIQPQMRCFFIRIPYHIFAFWGPVILLLIGLERITLLKFPIFYKFHIRKRILFALAMLSLSIPLSVLGIAYVVVVKQNKTVPICYNRFATQLNHTDIATIYYANVYALIAVVYVTFGVMMMRRYRKLSDRRASGFAGYKNSSQKGETSLSESSNGSVKTVITDGKSANSVKKSKRSASVDGIKTVTDGKLDTKSVRNVKSVKRQGSASVDDNAKSLMKALMAITTIYILAWMICIAALLASIGDTITTPKQLQLALYVSPLLYVNHGCNFFVFGWTSKLYLRAYRKTVVKCWRSFKWFGKQLVSVGQKLIEKRPQLG